jgi:hypothetical protein
MVLTALVGAESDEIRDELFCQLPELTDATPGLIAKLTAWLRFYPREAGYRVRPRIRGVLEEFLIAQALAESSGLVRAVAAAARHPEQAAYIFRVLADASGHADVARSAIGRLIAAGPGRFLPIVIDLASSGVAILNQAAGEAIFRGSWQTLW